MTYLKAINQRFREIIGRQEQLVCFGQNIAAGSHLSGFTRDIPQTETVRCINTPNCENAQVAFGMGMMINGVNSIFFVKQLDFLLLSIDQIVNTYNMVRLQGATASFTVCAIMVDQGYEGPQSRLNNLSDFCSLADIDGYVLSEPNYAIDLLDRTLVKPGFRIITASQRMFGMEASSFLLPQSPDGSGLSYDGNFVWYAKGGDVTIVSFNYSYLQAKKLYNDLMEQGISPSLVSAVNSNIQDFSAVLDNVAMTKAVICIDDSRSVNRPVHRLQAQLAQLPVMPKMFSFLREVDNPSSIGVNADQFHLDKTPDFLSFLNSLRSR